MPLNKYLHNVYASCNTESPRPAREHRHKISRHNFALTPISPLPHNLDTLWDVLQEEWEAIPPVSY
ncbi:hypothetical protein BC938DRAFT_476149 [Jimgerdemannia flammicorona]|uniref:Uncharacterized protein n=1 Tax=Jimgerdemannia flammicorona TaxID=994334 RepID=A0A433PK60_9FUNG|nr:hypothetical protein BC938DRAFT_476149 [Jimgerdemannia flammicorona]